jgi:hypothetical protein
MHVKVYNTVFKKWKIHDLDMHIFGQLLLVDKQKVPYLYKTTYKDFEVLH